MSMNPEIKALWLKALRSGDFAQVQGHLGDTKGFCCLGVLCEIAVAKGKITKELRSLNDNEDRIVYDVHSLTTLSDKVQDWAELSARDPCIQYEGDCHTLSSLNDEVGLNFVQIADVIEKEL